jgi:hypothetical protein
MCKKPHGTMKSNHQVYLGVKKVKATRYNGGVGVKKCVQWNQARRYDETYKFYISSLDFLRSCGKAGRGQQSSMQVISG